MYAVVNHLPIKPGADRRELAAKLGAFDAATREAHPTLISTSLVRASDSQAILVVVYRDR